MDVAEFARQRAAALHDDLVCAGYDPAQPYTFVLAEAARRDIEVRGYPPGHALPDVLSPELSRRSSVCTQMNLAARSFDPLSLLP